MDQTWSRKAIGNEMLLPAISPQFVRLYYIKIDGLHDVHIISDLYILCWSINLFIKYLRWRYYFTCLVKFNLLFQSTVH